MTGRRIRPRPLNKMTERLVPHQLTPIGPRKSSLLPTRGTAVTRRMVYWARQTVTTKKLLLLINRLRTPRHYRLPRIVLSTGQTVDRIRA